MSIVHMALREILRRKTTYLLATLAVAVAVVTVLTVPAALRTYDLRSDALLARKEAELKERLNVLQDEMRRATLKLSFNLAILLGDQDVREWHVTDCARLPHVPAELSVGERQRVALARALFHRPQLVLAKRTQTRRFWHAVRSFVRCVRGAGQLV